MKKNMNKKGAELSINVIIIAVLALVVLVVLILIFTGRIGKVGKGTEEASKQFELSRCDIPGTGRYCSNNCGTDQIIRNIVDANKECGDVSKGTTYCCG